MLVTLPHIKKKEKEKKLHMNVLGFFLKNNQIPQTILLVRQRFKLFSFLTIRV